MEGSADLRAHSDFSVGTRTPTRPADFGSYSTEWRAAEVLISMPEGTHGFRGRADLLTG